MGIVSLRDVRDADLETFFDNHKDPVAVQMAAFTHKDPSDRTAFFAHWAKILADPANLNKTILLDGAVVGNIASFPLFGNTEVTYWIARHHWGKGVATRALNEFVKLVDVRPLHARVAADNAGSIRVLEKCGFEREGVEKGFANARQAEIEELVLVLKTWSTG